ncbi:MAG: AAC(3) family N-acetyltransferase [Bacteroidales bacterium]|nr:AAC(3) family N-acetyltransferase [Bacteroidales bacterium]MCF8344272.1 AAC(3) family N-acetyltransferase [Bacteroidales bacterium]MCF8351658.1 AAC(3) family N-acetyltransferase [Bacteroidales bacterium]MCF8375519.1 AAC(3) family N-acetyltransferase [Bacteroidales bacterium]MCF8399918.1 AAC(3) family N-acetyltransferase [Bacteroidales bacterium]
MSENKSYIPYQEIINYPEVEQGDKLVIASDITRLALISRKHQGAFDIREFIKSFQEKVGKEGTLLIPAYNHHLRPGESWDIKNTKPVTGVLAISVMNNMGFVRTKNPLHSFMVWGKHAGFYSGLENKSSFGNDSPFAHFAPHQAKMLCIGTSMADALTYVHFYEELAKVKYRKYKTFPIKYKDENGVMQLKDFYLFAKKMGWVSDFEYLEKKFRENKLIRDYNLNGLGVQLLSLKAAVPVIRKEILEEHARHISFFKPGLYAREVLKTYLYRLKLFTTSTDRIRHADNIH